MAVQFGTNVDRTGSYDPLDIAATGARWVRVVAFPSVDLTRWLVDARNAGLKILLVIAHESTGSGTMSLSATLHHFRALYAHLVDAWQLGNEPDHVSDSSWTLQPGELSAFYSLGRYVLPEAFLVGAGLAGGDPVGYLDQVDLGPLNALGLHGYGLPGRGGPNPYGNSQTLGQFLDRFRRFGLPLVMTEDGIQHADLRQHRFSPRRAPATAARPRSTARADHGIVVAMPKGPKRIGTPQAEDLAASYLEAKMRDVAGRDDVLAWIQYAWSSEMGDDWGLIDHPLALEAFKRVALKGQDMATDLSPWQGKIGTGLLDMMQADDTKPAQRVSTWLPLGVTPSDVEEAYGENGVRYVWLLGTGQGHRFPPDRAA